MSTIAYVCPRCNRQQNAPSRSAGSTRPCPHCGQPAIVPQVVTAEPGAFDFVTEEEPLIRRRRARHGSAAHAVPLWGMFLILLTVFLGALGWGGWRLYDTRVRQPYFREVKTLFQDWFLTSVNADVSRDDAERERQNIARLEKVLEQAGGDPQDMGATASDLASARVNRQDALRQQRLARERARQLDEEARRRYGVPAGGLPDLLPNREDAYHP